MLLSYHSIFPYFGIGSTYARNKAKNGFAIRQSSVPLSGLGAVAGASTRHPRYTSTVFESERVRLRGYLYELKKPEPGDFSTEKFS